jgi:hypothetical protein
MDNEKMWAIVIMFIVLAGALAGSYGCRRASQRTEKFAELGYEQVVVPGSSCPVWQKVRQQ